MTKHLFAGFGFGPIQAGLFAKEAFQSGSFRRIVIAEIDQRLVGAVRSNGGRYAVNVAKADGIDAMTIDGVELLNPTQPKESETLRKALVDATEIATCLPSVSFYDSGQADSVAALVADGLLHRRAEATLVYAAENNNHAAEILQESVTRRLGTPLPPRVQFLNTVIGKMSRVVTDPAEIADQGLAPIAPGIDRAFLVEEFNRILVSKATIPGFMPGIPVFIEKEDLLPFEEAKLYGHNAIHALLGFIGALKGYAKMTELTRDEALMHVGREAFVKESAVALVAKYASLGDTLFTEEGYQHYAEDLLERMTNPYLADSVARAARDVVRKLGLNDRIFGTMTLAMDCGIKPRNMAMGAVAGVALLLANADEYKLPEMLRGSDWRTLDAHSLEPILAHVWQGAPSPWRRRLIDCTSDARETLARLLAR